MRFSRKLSLDEPAEISFMETNAQEAISAVSRGDCSIGFVRYSTELKNHFEELFDEKKLISETVAEFSPSLITKKDSSLGKLGKISAESLKGYIEIAFGNSFIPVTADTKKFDQSGNLDKRILVYDLITGLSLLENIPNSYMYTSPLPKSITECYGLTSKTTNSRGFTCKDTLIYRREYKLSELDKRFITEVCSAKRECFP